MRGIKALVWGEDTYELSRQLRPTESIPHSKRESKRDIGVLLRRCEIAMMENS